MQINVIDYIAKANECLKESRADYAKACDKAVRFFCQLFKKQDEQVLEISSRIKDEDSLKEKIVRKDLYKLYFADELLSNMSDIIGIRIECRFLADEKLVYEKLKELLTGTEDGIFFFSPKRQDIQLKLSSPQPETQANGLEIYRLDGRVISGDTKYNFELQIKSLVNAFWSEIEHKIIYKNKRFMMIDSFVSELMSSINKNLYVIDNQLHMLYKRCLGNAINSDMRGIYSVLAFGINEIYSRLIEEKMGFAVNIKNYCESLVQYIFTSSSFASRNNSNSVIPYDGIVFRVMDWIRSLDIAAIPVCESIELTAPKFSDPAKRVIAEALLKNMNDDFFCNIFFHMLFSIETGTDEDDFRDYVAYYKLRIAGDKHLPPSALSAIFSRYDSSKLVLDSVIDDIAAEVSALMTPKEKNTWKNYCIFRINVV